jgi:hypothetical protein
MRGMDADIEIFRPGRFTALSGQSLEFSAADLAAAAAAYDPKLAPAPIVVGHPEVNAPAYGWVDKLSYSDERLRATPRELEPAFAASVKAGRYKKVSAKFFRPNSPFNPKPGSYYLMHVGFLGAHAPAVPGLKPVEFAAAGDDDAVTVEFAAPDAPAWPMARIARSLREWIVAKFGIEDADQVIPGHLAEELEAAAREPAKQSLSPAPAFSAPADSTEEPTTMKPEEIQAAQQKLAKERQEHEAAFAAREARIADSERKARTRQLTELVDGLEAEGRVLPKDKAGLVAFMASIGDDQTVEFAAGDDTVKKPTREWFEGWLKELPKRVDYDEFAAATRHAPGDIDDLEREARAIAGVHAQK